MTIIDIDLNNQEHVRAAEYYPVMGHPYALPKGDEEAGEIDIYYREYFVNLYNLDYEAVVEQSNGSQHTILNNDPNNFHMQIGFFTDDDSTDFAVNVKGRLRYCTETRNAVFVPEHEERLPFEDYDPEDPE